ncbi:TRAP transporter large permease subunit [Pseudoruegeria sp. SK021]|uniref:TRAP transporter large permease n=1 Tax=Pseudoruegeria sp. SK021 TaxID=1933035 RepID=UPI000A25A674|nr:TRAP transporter large permease subunit [Pseudoruegeria sp. SK021]OSP55984.1 C4-dicarboxylate ABC transporter permease [Pseudoruegeria sp. SK021]
MFDTGTISLVLLLGMLLLLAIGMPLAFASAALAVGVLFMKFGPDFLFGNFGTGPLNILAQRVYGLMTDYVLISIPLFIFMANLLERSGIAKEMYNSLNIWLSGTRGGIAIVTSIMAVIMAAMSGIIGGEVVLLGLIALPQMLRLGYNQNLAIGTICASGSLGTMIPPSIVLIIYGLITETSIKALFTASFLPGFILASFFIIYIVVRTQLNPSLAPLPEPIPGEPRGGQKGILFAAFMTVIASGFCAALFLRALFFTVTGQNAEAVGVDRIALGTPDDAMTFGIALAVMIAALLFLFGRARTAKAWSMGKGLVAPMVVIGVVLGSIYGGITGITEAAGMGVIAVAVIALMRGEMSVTLMWDSLKRTLKSTGTIIWVTIGATALAGAYTIAGGPTYIANLIIGAELPTMGIILIMMLIFLFMGALMDWVGIVLLIMPVFLPIVLRLPVEELGLFGTLEKSHVAIWFGVVFCMNMQVSFLSPPFGPAAFYLKSVAPAHISLTDIFKGFLPFIGIQLLALSLLLIWPPLIAVFL